MLWTRHQVPGEPAQILLADGLVDGGAASDSLAVVVRRVGPPVGLHLDVTQDHVLDGCRKSGNLPRDVGLPAAEGFGEVLQDRPGLVLLDALRHHVEDVVHDGGAKLEVKVGLDPLLRHRLGHALRVSTLELPREEVAEPAFEQRGHSAEEEEPNPPTWGPKATSGALSDGSLKLGPTLLDANKIG